jgi:hypothetical protein
MKGFVEEAASISWLCLLKPEVNSDGLSADSNSIVQ